MTKEKIINILEYFLPEEKPYKKMLTKLYILISCLNDHHINLIKYKYLTTNDLHNLLKRKFGCTASYYNNKIKYLNLII